VTPENVTRALSEFLLTARDAVVFEDGAVTFDLAQAKYSISGEYNKCLLHLWSSERNIVRRILDLRVKNDVLSLQVQKLGQTSPLKIEICRRRDQRTPTAKRAARLAYERVLRRVLERRFPGFGIVRLTSAMDLERSFGPIYARGLIRQGQAAWAVLGVNAGETQSSIDAALTFAILWLDACRHDSAGKFVVQGVKLILPAGCSALTRERMSLLHPGAAKWELYEFDGRTDNLARVDLGDRGNLATRLAQAVNEAAVRERFARAIAQVREVMPEAEVVIRSAAEIGFCRHGLEFARARLATEAGSFRSSAQVVFGVGAEETLLTEHSSPAFIHLAYSIGEVRHSRGPRDHALFRLHPERWLESLAVQNLAALDDRLDPTCLYSQVPAFSASDRAMIDVLAATREGRLAVVELKADEDIHLPMQGLDYWSRVAWHHGRGEFRRFGYFPGRQLSAEPPLLLLVAPALRVHPATDALLRYLSPEIEWILLGIDEHWRERVRVVFRKRPEASPRERTRMAVPA
jgi:hypothetical protein